MNIPPYAFPETPVEFKVMVLREFAPCQDKCDQPDAVAKYCRANIETSPYFNPDVECFYVLILDTRRAVKGHYLVSTGTLDTLMIHPREVFKTAIVTSASAIILVHNHPSGDPSPSSADISATNALVRGGEYMQIPVLDHVILGHNRHASLRELGYIS
jgi:DNA repair protein RadC